MPFAKPETGTLNEITVRDIGIRQCALDEDFDDAERGVFGRNPLALQLPEIVDRCRAEICDGRDTGAQREHAADHAEVRLGASFERADAFMRIERFHAVRKTEPDFAAIDDRDVGGRTTHGLRTTGYARCFCGDGLRDRDARTVAEAALGIGCENRNLRGCNACKGDGADQRCCECECFHWYLPVFEFVSR